jgi:putative ABC transport system permease protein
MIRSYFLIGLRTLLKQKSFSLIKVVGLALGLATSIIIYLFIKEDLSYDKFNSKYERVVRLLTIDQGEGVSSKLVGVTPPRLGPTSADELPEVLESVRFIGGGPYELSFNDKPVKSTSAMRVDPSVFKVFDIKIINGPETGILDKPGSIAITETLAKKIFGQENPIGKTVKLNQQTDLNITAVLADPPKNSHIQFDLLHTLVPGKDEDGLRQGLDSWQNIFCRTYLLLDKPVDVPDLNSKLQALSKKNNAVEFFIPVVQRLEDVHLHSKEILFESNSNKSDVQNIYVLSSIAALIVLLAVVNFINLVTANATTRAKEIGMRKVIGAIRPQLIYQHLTESIIITFIATFFALLITYSVLPWLNNLYQRFADFNILFESENLLLLFGLILVVGLLAGMYPAFVLSSFKPVLVLKGAFKSSNHGIRLRKALVVLQFTISIALIAGTGIVYQQMRFIYSADLGYNREQVITIQHNGNTIQRSATFKNELLTNQNIVAAGTASSRLGQQLGRTQIYPEGLNSASTNIIASVMGVDHRFIPTMDMKILEGRNFVESGADSLSMIVNEEMVRLLKWENDPVGRKISLQTGPNAETDQTAYTVVGVVKDFHFATVRHKLEPMFMLYGADNPAVAIRVKPENMDATIAFIEEKWKKVNPGTTFEFSFLDEEFANLYRNEKAFSAMFTHFTILALFIATVGLFGLSAFTAQQRKKEIGIRKVLGASNGTIFYRLSSEYISLILIAFPLASVISYFVMKEWLQDFQYSISIGFGIFAVSGLVAVVISLLTISSQAIKAAFSNPVNSLRSE